MLSYISQDIYCNYMHPLYSTVHEDLVIPLSPSQISYCKFVLLTDKHIFLRCRFCSLRLIATIITQAYHVGACSTKTTVLHYQYDDSAVHILFHGDLHLRQQAWRIDKLALFFCNRYAFKAHRLFNQPSLRDSLPAESLGRSYVAIEMILHPQNQCDGRRLFLRS